MLERNKRFHAIDCSEISYLASRFAFHFPPQLDDEYENERALDCPMNILSCKIQRWLDSCSFFKKKKKAQATSLAWHVLIELEEAFEAVMRAVAPQCRLKFYKWRNTKRF